MFIPAGKVSPFFLSSEKRIQRDDIAEHFKPNILAKTLTRIRARKYFQETWKYYVYGQL